MTSSTVPSTPVQARGGAASAVRSGLRGADFASGDAMLTPRVQHKRAPSTPVQMAPLEVCDSADPLAGGPDAAQVGKATQDFGEVSSIDQALSVVGGFFDVLAPQPGISSEVELKLAVVMEFVYLDWSIKGSVERTDKGMTMELTNTVSVGVGMIAEGTKAFCGIRGTTVNSINGDSGYECVRMYGLSLYEWLASQEVTLWDVLKSPQYAALRASGAGKAVADAMWGASFREDVLRDMDAAGTDEADTISSSGTLAAAAGAAGGAGGAEAGVEATLGARTTTTLAKGADGKLASSSETNLYAKLELEFGPVACEIEVDGPDSLAIEIEIELPDSDDDLVMMVESVLTEAGAKLQPALTDAGSAPACRDHALELLYGAPRAVLSTAAAAAGFAKRVIGIDIGIDKGAPSIAVSLVHKLELPDELGSHHGGAAAGASLEAEVKTKTQLAGT